LFDWFGIGAVNGALLWGALGVASPILIHLLSRRRFRIVDWAPMELLLEAERRNRRRIRLEHLLLLALRCLAVILAAALVARLFLERSGLAARAAEAARIERIVLLDDSPSMEAALGVRTVFDEAKSGLAEFVRQTAREHPGDTLTLLVTSEAHRPVLNGQYLAGSPLEAVIRTIEGLELSDKSASYDCALGAMEEMLSSPRGNLNRAVTIITDLRRRDWAAAADSPPGAAGLLTRRASPPDGAEITGSGAVGQETRRAKPVEYTGAGPREGSLPAGPLGVLARVAEKADAVAVVNVGGQKAPNLAVVEVALREKALVAGVPSAFEVVIANHGDAASGAVPVALTLGDSAPLRAEVDRVEPGGRAAVAFTLTFSEAGPAAVRAEIGADLVPRDNTRFFAAAVRPGVPILLVDGEPSSEYGQTETFYLERALDPPGPTPSGNAVRVVTENQFEEMPLEGFQVVFLANLYRVTDGRAAALREWVRAGGGLVVFLGDQIDEAIYNEKLYAGGAGLLPVRLLSPAGDEAERRWVNLNPAAANHPVLRVFEGADNPFLARVKFFRWWQAAVRPEDTASGRTRVLAACTDADSSPALVESRFGDGRVLFVASSADDEWNSWPADPSYLVTVLEMARYVARSPADSDSISAGQPIRVGLDPSLHSSAVQVEPPPGAPAVALQAAPADDGGRLRVEYEDTARRGFYRLRLKRHDGGEETRLFAANVDPTEGDLAPADVGELRRTMAGTKVVFLEGREYLAHGPAGAKTEVWRPVLIALVAALCLEQALAWWFGTRR